MGENYIIKEKKRNIKLSKSTIFLNFPSFYIRKSEEFLNLQFFITVFYSEKQGEHKEKQIVFSLFFRTKYRFQKL